MTTYGKVIIVKTFLTSQLIYCLNCLHINNLSFPKLQTRLKTSYGQIKNTSLKKKYYMLLKRWEDLI